MSYMFELNENICINKKNFERIITTTNNQNS